MAELCTCGFQFRRTQVTAQPARNAAVFTTAVTVRRANKSLQAVVGCAPFFSLLILALLAPLTTCLELRGHGSAVGTKGVDVSRGPAVVGCPQRSSLSEKKAVKGRGVVLLCCAGCVRSLNLPPGRGTVRAALAFRTKTPTKTMETLAPEIRFHAVVAACYVRATGTTYLGLRCCCSSCASLYPCHSCVHDLLVYFFRATASAARPRLLSRSQQQEAAQLDTRQLHSQQKLLPHLLLAVATLPPPVRCDCTMTQRGRRASMCTIEGHRRPS